MNNKAAPALVLLFLLMLTTTSTTSAARVLQYREAQFSILSPSPSPSPSVVPSPTPTVILVAQDDSGDFRTVQDAVNSIPSTNSQRVTVHVKAGVYTEKVVIKSPWITLEGEGADSTVIQYGDTAGTAGNSTYNSASVAVAGDHFTARNIAFRNTAPMPAGGVEGEQAVAVRIDGDYAAFYHVSFYGFQDTLYDRRGRHYFENCYIQGTVDFIFGNGTSYYNNCSIHSVAPGSAGTEYVGVITAHNRKDASESSGFVFVNCDVSGSGGPIYLGRAWGPAARVVFAFTNFMDNIINPSRWYDWGKDDSHDTIFFAEYSNTGVAPAPADQAEATDTSSNTSSVYNYMVSADTSKMVPWAINLDAQTALPFLSTSFIDGDTWLHTT